MLKVEELTASYGRIEVLHGLSLEVAEGEIVAIVGANGAGKTTLMKTIAGVHPAAAGRIEYDGADATRLAAHRRVAAGLSLVPEGRQVFGPLSVRDNLRLGAFRRGVESDIAAMEEMFPILAERRHQAAASLSGGQQQMLAIARALMSAPRLLLLDEPSLGLAPQMVDRVFDLVAELKAEGLAMLLVEQNVPLSLEIADRVAVLANGRVSVAGTAAELAGSDLIRGAYLAA